MASTLPGADVAVNRIRKRVARIPEQVTFDLPIRDTSGLSLQGLGHQLSSAAACSCRELLPYLGSAVAGTLRYPALQWLPALPWLAESLVLREYGETKPLDQDQLDVVLITEEGCRCLVQCKGVAESVAIWETTVPHSWTDLLRDVGEKSGSEDWETYGEPLFDPLEQEVHLAVRDFFERADANSEFR